MSFQDSTLEPLIGDQQAAWREINDWMISDVPMMSLTGYAGTGKTYLMDRISNKNTGICAPTHKAVRVLRSKVKSYNFAKTIHSALGLTEHIDSDGKMTFIQKGIYYQTLLDSIHLLIVDESSMIDDALFVHIKEASEKFGFKVLFVGDPFQALPVNLHAVSIPCSVEECDSLGIRRTWLNEIVRQAVGNPIIQLSMMVREHGIKYVQNNLLTIEKENELGGVEVLRKHDLPDLHSRLYLSPEAEKDVDHVKTVAYTNNLVDAENVSIRRMVMGEVGPNVVVGDLLVLSAPYLEGKKILLDNSDEVMVVNLEFIEGDLNMISDEYPLSYYKATVEELETGRDFIVKILHNDSIEIFEDACLVLSNYAKKQKKGTFFATGAWKQFWEVKRTFLEYKFIYASTAHKSQGSTYQHTIIMVNSFEYCKDDLEKDTLFYTSITRSEKKIYLIV